MTRIDARLLQLADSAFPSGSFAHSLGFEALVQLGLLRDEASLTLRLRELVATTAHGALRFVEAAHLAVNAGAAGEVQRIDDECDVFLSSHVANRASRAQAAAFLIAIKAALGIELDARAHTHVAVAMGSSLARAGFAVDDVRHLFLFTTIRSALSAAVRLGVVGPLRAQAVLANVDFDIDEHATDTACSTSPLVDIAQAAQDRLYSRLFQS